MNVIHKCIYFLYYTIKENNDANILQLKTIRERGYCRVDHYHVMFHHQSVCFCTSQLVLVDYNYICVWFLVYSPVKAEIRRFETINRAKNTNLLQKSTDWTVDCSRSILKTSPKLVRFSLRILTNAMQDKSTKYPELNPESMLALHCLDSLRKVTKIKLYLGALVSHFC